MNYRNANNPLEMPSLTAWNEMSDAVREHLCLEDALHVVLLSLPQELWRSPLPSWPMGAGTPAWPGTLRALPTGTSLCMCRVSWGGADEQGCSGSQHCYFSLLRLYSFSALLYCPSLECLLFPFFFIPQSHLLSRPSQGHWMSS